MSQKAVLTYFEGRGRAEMVRLAMVAAGIEWSDVYLKEVADFENLKTDGKLLFGQVPLLEIDGKNLVQSSAIVRYIARKANLLGDNADEAVRIDTLYEGTRDLLTPFGQYAFANNDEVIKKANTAINRYLPIFEKALKDNGSNGYLVGNRLTLPDVGLLEPLLWVEELLNDELKPYPEVQNFFQNMKSNQQFSRYLSGPQRNRINDERYVTEVKRVLQW